MRDPLLRILDANANRAREALRVLEDIARFALNDTHLALQCKTARHRLVELISKACPDSRLRLASRDTEHDVGVNLSAPAEYRRADLFDIAGAAAGRLTEALRSLEECTKAQAPPIAPELERLRYQAYTLEQTVRMRLPRPAARQWTLCVLITADLCTHHTWHEVALAAMMGGADCLQLREKNLSDRELLARARALVHIAAGVERSPAPQIVINDRPDIALLAGADGVHLGQDDLPLSQVRTLSGDQLQVGVTCATLDEVQDAVASGADYIGLGPMFPSPTKPKPHIAGPRLLQDVLCNGRLAEVPHLAISGITPPRATELARIGCRGIAVSRAVCASPDPAQACRELRSAMLVTAV
ncbi:MAG: thiamine phosphate synthase [Phycisphaeraceae bacterium]|nr:thiamine phosphate synthase [Phycisphaeraceae bacterium]MCW5753339.1 thiamine phosphate synthase [Phycisphaeraceae bacterium]